MEIANINTKVMINQVFYQPGKLGYTRKAMYFMNSGKNQLMFP